MLKTQKRVGQCEKPYSKYEKLCGLGSVWFGSCFRGCMSIYMISNGMWNSRVHQDEESLESSDRVNAVALANCLVAAGVASKQSKQIRF